MGTDRFIELCKSAIEGYIFRYLTENKNYEIYVVWSCKTLQNNKALLSTNLQDDMYYECTYNGDKNELYLDAYKKQRNVCIKNFKKEEE